MENITTVNYGGFPKNVLEFQDSTNYLQQLIFIDYQLQLLIQNEFTGKEFLHASHFEHLGNNQPKEKLLQLISYVATVNDTYHEEYKTDVEKFYYNVIMSHLFYLNSQIQELNYQLDSVPLTSLQPTTSKAYNEFVEYLICRYHVIVGFSTTSSGPLIDYLTFYKRPFKKSQTSANYWLSILYLRLTLNLTSEGQTRLAFDDLKQLRFWNNEISLIGFASYLLKVASLGSDYINGSFKQEFSSYLTNLLNSKIGIKLDFPNSSDTGSDWSHQPLNGVGVHELNGANGHSGDSFSSGAKLNDFVYNLYENLFQIPFSYTILKPSLSKKFLVNSTLKTYQSQTILINLVKVLIEVKEFDEALAAFKTLRHYIEKDIKQDDGNIDDLLSIIQTYAISLINFNPLKLQGLSKSFKHTSEDKVLVALQSFSEELFHYLNVLKEQVDLSYDEEEASSEEGKDKEADNSTGFLSFLYKKYNVNILLSDHSNFVELISQAWYSLGYYYYFLSIHQSTTGELLESYKSKVVKYYKNSLIVNSTGNVTYLFSYALVLSFDGHLKESLKLCKFILKKYPESFKTWNLMVLLLTSFEANDPDYVKPGTAQEQQDSFGGVSGSAPVPKESEKFINNALNIAGLFIAKHHQKDVKLTTEAKYEILQLKLTQMAVWESIHGVQYILEFLSEVFILYHELFAVNFEQPKEHSNAKPLIPLAHDSKWSHRPSVVDPSKVVANHTSNGNANGVVVNGNANGSAKPRDLTRRLSRRSKANGHSTGNDTLNNLKNLSSRTTNPSRPSTSTMIPQGETIHQNASVAERKILQDVWLWTSKIYLKIGLLEESEQCIVEAESVYEPNVKTYTMLGYLTSKSRKFLAQSELEKSLEILSKDSFNKVDYGSALLGLSKLFIIDDEANNSLFISTKDRDAGIIRLKNLLEKYSLSWPYGANNVEVWYYLSKIYETIDDKTLFTKSLWRCVELEDFRPVRAFITAEDYRY